MRPATGLPKKLVSTGRAELDRALDHGAVGEAQRQGRGVRVGGGGDLDERAGHLAVDHPPVVRDQVEATVVPHAGVLELDLVGLRQAEPLHRGERDRRDGHSLVTRL